MWKALQTPDRTGNVRRYFARNPKNHEAVKSNLDSVRYNRSVTDITGAELDYEVDPTRPPQVRRLGVVRGFMKGILIVDLTTLALVVAAYGVQGAIDRGYEQALETFGLLPAGCGVANGSIVCPWMYQTA